MIPIQIPIYILYNNCTISIQLYLFCLAVPFTYVNSPSIYNCFGFPKFIRIWNYMQIIFSFDFVCFFRIRFGFGKEILLMEIK